MHNRAPCALSREGQFTVSSMGELVAATREALGEAQATASAAELHCKTIGFMCPHPSQQLVFH